MTNCDHIAHRLAAGDALNEDQRAHAELCATCIATLDAQRTITAIGRARAAIEPSPGFASRVASRAFERVAERRRNRLGGYALGTTGAVAMAAIAMLWWRGHDAGSRGQTSDLATLPAAMYPPQDPTAADSGGADDDAPADLVWLTDADRALAYSANWELIEEPIAPYAVLLGEGSIEPPDFEEDTP
ncbi:MAG TPA: hypothetical protein VML75_15045 [Kofleriaceae bacterium]|nr:hypothetical protein [Kofleriaceae bacterium]